MAVFLMPDSSRVIRALARPTSIKEKLFRMSLDREIPPARLFIF